MNNKAVIFDLDGTLWDTLEVNHKSLNEVAKKYHCAEISKELVRQNYGNNKIDTARMFFPKLSQEEAFKLIDESDALNVINLIKNGGYLYPGLENELLKLKKTCDLYIVSNSSTHKYIEAFLISSSLSKFFKDYIAASEINLSKGEAILKIINDYHIKEAIYVGDTKIDYEASKIAKIPFIQCLYGFGKELDCKYKIKDIKELSACVKNVFENEMFMDVNYEYIDPYDEKYDYLMRIEHLGRYNFAADSFNGFNKVLDVACADGYGTNLLSKRVSNIIGVDRNEKYLKIAKEKYNGDNIIYKKIDINEDVIDGNYDGIACFETLEHLKYPLKFLYNLYDILNDDGTLILSIPNEKYEIIENGKNLDSFHLHVFKYEDIINIIKQVGFKIEKIYGQSYINKIVHKEITNCKLTNVINDAKTIAYPNEEDLNKSYSFIFVLKKR